MQRVGFERLARGLVRHPVEQPRAEEIDHDRDGDDREGPSVASTAWPWPPNSRCAASQITTPDSTNSSAVSASAATLSTLP